MHTNPAATGVRMAGGPQRTSPVFQLCHALPPPPSLTPETGLLHPPTLPPNYCKISVMQGGLPPKPDAAAPHLAKAILPG